MWISICRKKDWVNTNKILQMHVMFTNKESSTNMQTMCLWLLNVAVSSSFSSSARSLYWHNECSGVWRNLIKLESIVTLPSLCHPAPHCFTSCQSDSIVFYYITRFKNINPLSGIFHPLLKPVRKVLVKTQIQKFFMWNNTNSSKFGQKQCVQAGAHQS